MISHEQHRTRTLWLTGVLHAFTHLYGVALLPLYLRIQQDLRLKSVEQATLLVTVMGAAYYLPSYPQGVLADRLSRKRLLTAGLAINALGFVGLSYAPNYFWALVSVVVAGLGGSFYHPAATALIARLFPEARGRALGLAGIGASAGFFLGPLYCGWRAVSSGSWRSPVFEIGMLGLAAAVLFASLADEERDAPGEPHAAGLKPAEERLKARGAEKLFPAPALWLFFLAASLLFSLRDFAGSAASTSASLFLQNAHHFSPKATGLAISGIFVASAISNPVFGRLSDGGRIRWISFVLVMSAVLISVFPRVPVGWMIPVLVIYGFFFLSSYPITEAALMEAVPDAVRGRVFGLFITISGLVSNLAHWLVGQWVGALGPGAFSSASYFPLYTTLAGLILLSLAALPFLHGLRKREQLGAPEAGAAPLPALHLPDPP